MNATSVVSPVDRPIKRHIIVVFQAKCLIFLFQATTVTKAIGTLSTKCGDDLFANELLTCNK